MPVALRPYRRFVLLVHPSGACALITLLLLSVGPVYAEWEVLKIVPVSIHR